MWGSNYTYLVNIHCGDTRIKGVYKPELGEQPLWDFRENSLAGREVCAFLVSEAGGWRFVPPTIYRAEGPAGPGSLQLHIEHDPNRHYFTLTPSQRDTLRPVALFDAVVNNTDRKGGHLIIAQADQTIWLIDHGICFHTQPKLRTVIWDFAGLSLSDAERAQLTALAAKIEPGAPLYQALELHLNQMELLALKRRIEHLLTLGEFPQPTDERYSYPWPPV